MIVKGSSIYRKTTPIKYKVIIVVFWISIIFGTEIIYREPLFNVSIDIIEMIQNYTSENFKVTMSYISYLANENFILLLIVVVYNFANIYKTFILITIFCGVNLIGNLLKLIYSNPRPFYYGVNNIKPYSCEQSYGNPSQHSLLCIVFYSTLFKFIIECRTIRKSKIIKTIFLIVFSTVICLILLSKLFIGVDSLNQIVFGFLIGCLIFYFIFYIIDIDVNNSKQLLHLIEMKIIYMIIFNLLMIIPIILLSFLKDYNTPSKQNWQNIINLKCDNFSTNLSFKNEALLNMITFFANIATVISLKLEYYFIFGDNSRNWTNYNFSLKSPDDSLLSNLSLEKDTQWNHTGIFISIIRLVISLILSGCVFIPFSLISDESNFFLLLFVKNFLTFSVIFGGFFFIFKSILKIFRLVNISVFMFTEQI
jgi:hypothetical protein